MSGPVRCRPANAIGESVELAYEAFNTVFGIVPERINGR